MLFKLHKFFFRISFFFLQFKFKFYLNYLKIAAFLDPSTRKYLNEAEVKEASELIGKCCHPRGKYYFKIDIPSQTTLNEETNKGNKQLKALNDLEKSCKTLAENEKGQQQRNKRHTYNDELAQYTIYFNEYDGSTFEEFWAKKAPKLPILAAIAKRFCAIPASSVASESAFSIANFIQRKERSGLSEETLRSSIMLREQHTFDKMYFVEKNETIAQQAAFLYL